MKISALLRGEFERRYLLAAILGAAAIAATTSYFMYRSYGGARRLSRAQQVEQQALTTRQTTLALSESFHRLEHELFELSGEPAVRRGERDAAHAAMERSFASVRELFVTDVSRADADGVIRDTLHSPELVGRDFSFRGYYKELRAGAPGAVYEFITFQGVRKGDKGIIVARGISDPGGRFAGPLVFVVDVTKLLERLLAGLPSGMQGWAVDADGVVLYHPTLPAGTPIGELSPPGPGFSRFAADLGSLPAVRGEYPAADGRGLTLATSGAVTVAGKRLVLVLEAPEELVERPLRDFKADTMLGTGISLTALFLMLLAILLLVTRRKRDLEREIAERKAAEARSKASEERFGQLIEYSPMAMMLVDGADDIVYVNRRFRERLGYTRESVPNVGRWFEAAYPDADYRRQQLERWRRYKERAGTAREERPPSTYSIAGRDGSVHSMELYAARIGDKDLVMFNDVTERARLEHQLRHAQKMECFGRLAGGVAHDFNNILTAIIGYGEILGDRVGRDSPLKFYVDTILRSAASAARLTSSLLAFSRRQVLHRRFIDVGETVRGIQRMLARIVGEDIAVELALADLDVGIVADPTQVEQVLMNLAANARDAMPDGGTIRIATAVVTVDENQAAELGAPRPGAFVRISFADTGVGMSEETVEHIFEPFFTTKEAGRGTGLGLAIVYGIVSQHGGYVSVHSAPGQGAIFQIHFPAAPFPPESERREDEFSAEQLPSGSGRLLLVEDEETVRETLTRILSGAGYEVVAARDGKEALALFSAQEGLDLVLLDVVMPGLSGAEVFRKMRELNPRVRVLFLSGYAQERLRHEDTLAAEGTAFLLKPVSRSKLLRALRELVSPAFGP